MKTMLIILTLATPVVAADNADIFTPADPQVATLRAKIEEQDRKIDRLLDELVKERKARQCDEPRYLTITTYRTERKWCPT